MAPPFKRILDNCKSGQGDAHLCHFLLNEGLSFHMDGGSASGRLKVTKSRPPLSSRQCGCCVAFLSLWKSLGTCDILFKFHGQEEDI